VGQEYFINSQQLENKVRNLLPSQGGSGAGFDLSASTQIIPIIDLTESAEGSNLRQDLQTSLSFNSITSFGVSNTTTDLIINTGYYRVFGTATVASDDIRCCFQLYDGVSTKVLAEYNYLSGSGQQVTPYDFVVFIQPSQILQGRSGSTTQILRGCSRQIATIDGELVNPL